TCYLFSTMLTLATIERATDNFSHYPWAMVVVPLNMLAIANIPRTLARNDIRQAFFSTSCTIAALVFLFGTALFPNLVTSQPNAANSLTVFNSASSETTLKLMAGIALIGMPFVVAYTGVVYWTFRGRVVIDKHSY
ncbi:MAG: cytochrome d ubiquinol oxidase subunit II, partial [Planctomycetales bacterium]|nr:cytochrome d ubiquinol oxidase subunit II [Planctomycetales bacterium]